MPDAPSDGKPNETQQLGGLMLKEPPPSSDEGRGLKGRPYASIPERESRVASTLTYVLTGLLGLVIAAQYVGVGFLVWINRLDAIPIFEHLFNAVLPVLAGLTGSAVTYYLTKEKK